jgi:hypothetical protein
MCIVIDACCVAKVFNPSDEQHSHFAPVLEWVIRGNGRMVYGGTKYSAELGKLRRYLKLIGELSRKGRVIQLPNAEVDVIADNLKSGIGDAKFNDEHLVAIVIASRCCVVCTNDDVAISYLKRPAFYSCHRMKHPKIYTSERNRNLCCNRHVTDICRE